MQIQEHYCERIKEKCYSFTHPSGLEISVCPKQDYSSTFAIFGTKYGSIDRSFSVNGEEKVTVPDGIAHYLEHKLFESEEGDAFKRFAETGANANAFTSFDKTCYLFNCSDNVEKNLEILLDFVQSPYFTPETVQKEQGIIGQEIKMYDDAPGWRVMFNMLGAMYHTHPVKIDIAGTVESISHITADLLYQCYNTFYNLNSMALCVVGNVTVEQIRRVADKMLKPAQECNIQRFFEKEPETIVTDYIEQKLPVAAPLFHLGFKENAHMYTAKEIAEIDVLLGMIASSSGELYESLMNENLINSTFSYEFSEAESYALIIFSGESCNPKLTAQKIREYIASLRESGLSRESFEIARRMAYGDAVSQFNSVSDIAASFIDSIFSARDYYEYVDAVAELNFEDVSRRFEKILCNNRSVLSVVSPLNADGESA